MVAPVIELIGDADRNKDGVLKSCGGKKQKASQLGEAIF
ncbi:hypothetical protein XBFFL1_2600001 [Xenorhabdus bovienii str. feltiae Florida]|nr:hypothetical protein XBFFR1_1020009 [Xenorhabdus bovienii str. feltiae France]CDG93634.1 hypothetical protein XBFFL1_2600001 [Xenorhabdus bovienii str. feltiae Florida]